MVADASDFEPYFDVARDAGLFVNEPAVCFEIRDVKYTGSWVDVAAQAAGEHVRLGISVSFHQAAMFILEPRHL